MSIKLSNNRIETLAKAVRKTGQLLSFYEGVTVDSRKVKPGFIFAAVKGYKTDGHLYIEKAVESGAALILTERHPEEIDAGKAAVMQVEDIRATISHLAFAFEDDPQNGVKIAGITGTNGKTTVSTLVHQVLSTLGIKAGLMGTVGRMIGDEVVESHLTTGDPEQIASDMAEMRSKGCSHLVMEVSSHALDQKRTEAITFNVGAFTNLSHDHLDYHGTAEAYRDAKKRLFDQLDENAVAVINTDEADAAHMVKDTKAVLWNYGQKDESMRIISNNADGLVIEIDEVLIESPLCGKFNASNVAAAYLVCRALGCSAENTAAALASAKGAKGRLERVEFEQENDASNELPAVFVDYAHTPDALKNVLETLRNMEPEKELTVVFGCGGDRDKSKRPVMGEIASQLADKIMITSDNPRTEDPEAIIKDILKGVKGDAIDSLADRPGAIRAAIHGAAGNGMVLIAGKGHETYQEVMGKRHHMDDFELAQTALVARATQTQGEN